MTWSDHYDTIKNDPILINRLIREDSYEADLLRNLIFKSYKDSLNGVENVSLKDIVEQVDRIVGLEADRLEDL